jgi:ubiquinone/menaquinone biosynthesis C-methylase UbiE
MLSITQKRIKKVKLSDRVELVCSDAANLPFKEDSFKAVFMSFTLELFDTPEIPLVLFECKRVLNKDGRLSVVAMSKNKTKKDTFTMRLYEWMHRKLPKYVDCRPIPLQEILKNAGFIVTSQEQFSTWRLPIIVALTKKTQ